MLTPDPDHAPGEAVTPAFRSRAARRATSAGRWLLACWIGTVVLPGGAAADQPPDGARAQMAGPGAPVERRIGRLHAVLQISGAEEAAWASFADVLRRNSAHSADVDDAWRRRSRSTDALAELDLYTAIEDADAENAHRLVTPFRALYAVLSPAQRRTADALVRRYIDAQTRRRP